MAVHNLYHGGKGVFNPYHNQYPSADVTSNDGLRQAAHKEPIAFGNTRMLDFSDDNRRRQAAFQKYLSTHTFAVGDEIILCAMPERALLLGVAWEVEYPEEGVSFTIKSKYTGLDFGELQLGNKDSGCVMLDEYKWLKKTDYIILNITGWPSKGNPTEGQFSVTPILFVPKLGN